MICAFEGSSIFAWLIKVIRITIACLVLFCVPKAQSQGLKGWSPKDSFQRAMRKVPGFRVGLDGRNSFLSGTAVYIRGARYGLDYGKVAFFTGYYKSGFRKIQEGDTFSTSFSYASTTFEYYVHQSWRFEVVTSYQIGWGYGRIDYNRPGKHTTVFDGNIIPVEIGIGGTMRFLRYFGVSAGLGLRLSLVQEPGFSGSYYYGGLTYYTGTMYRDYKKWRAKYK